jgi:AraC family transcriptional regulator of adaptative response/methylated-DNA-[protein]-cysteine methyltransferase
MKKIATLTEPEYGFSDTPFGECCIAFSAEGVRALIFPESREAGTAGLEHRFPGVNFVRNDAKAAAFIQQVFESDEKPALHPIGTDFQKSVWHALQQIPAGQTTTYAKIAESIGRPKAVRAVGTAIGANPIGFLIPCHRVIRTDGGLGGFRWGLDCKKKMLEWERK